jgi:hypothetical protein
MKLIIAVLVALALAPAAEAKRHQPAPVNYGQQVQLAANEVAGQPVAIQCDTAESVRDETGQVALAYVQLGTPRIHLGPTVCGYLAYPRSETYGGALLVVLHEALHLRWNSADEALTQCRALAAFPGIVQRYFPRLNARALAYGASRVDALVLPQYHGASC